MYDNASLISGWRQRLPVSGALAIPFPLPAPILLCITCGPFVLAYFLLLLFSLQSIRLWIFQCLDGMVLSVIFLLLLLLLSSIAKVCIFCFSVSSRRSFCVAGHGTGGGSSSLEGLGYMARPNKAIHYVIFQELLFQEKYIPCWVMLLSKIHVLLTLDKHGTSNNSWSCLLVFNPLTSKTLSPDHPLEIQTKWPLEWTQRPFQDFNDFPLSFCCKNSQKYYLYNKDLLTHFLSYRYARCFLKKNYENWQIHLAWHPLQSYVQCPSAFREFIIKQHTFNPHSIRMLHKKGC